MDFSRQVPGIVFANDGAVVVDADMMTGHAGIFAGGDMVAGRAIRYDLSRSRQAGGAAYRCVAARRAL